MGVLDTVLAYKAQKDSENNADLKSIGPAMTAFQTAKNAAHTSLLQDLTVKIAGAKQGLAVDTERGLLTPDATLEPARSVYQIGQDASGNPTLIDTGSVKKNDIVKSAPSVANQDVTKIKLYGDPNLKGQEYLQDVMKKNPAYGNDLTQVINGTLDTTKNGGRNGMKAAQLQADAAQALMDENGVSTFDPSQAGVRAAVYKAFTSGNESNQMKSANQLIVHTGTLSDAMKALDPGQFPDVNAFNNWLKSKAGQGTITAVKTALEPVSSEAQTLFKGQGNSSQIADSAIQRFEAAINKGNLSPEQFEAFRTTLMKLTSSRLGTALQKLTNSPGAPIPITLFNPEAQARLREFGINPEQFSKYGNAKDTSTSDTSQKLPEGVTEDDIQATMKANKLTREEVLKRISK